MSLRRCTAVLVACASMALVACDRHATTKVSAGSKPPRSVADFSLPQVTTPSIPVTIPGLLSPATTVKLPVPIPRLPLPTPPTLPALPHLELGSTHPSEVRAAWFVDDHLGFVLGSSCSLGHCVGRLWRTDDGGTHWRRQTTPVPTTPEGGYAAQLLFTDASNGFAFGPNLDVTHDGGNSWQRVGLGFAVKGIVARGDSVWALVVDTVNGQAEDLLRTSPDRGRTWTAPRSLGPTYNSTSFSRASDKEGWVTGSIPANGYGGGIRLRITTDGGTAWHEVATPADCARAGWFAPVQATGPDRAWLECLYFQDNESEAKQVWRTDDGGAHWSLRSQSDGFPGAATSPGAKGSGEGSANGSGLPHAGYQFGVAPTSPESAWLALAPQGLLTTADGGRTWHGSTGTDFTGVNGATGVQFVDSAHGWATSVNGVWRTTDAGGHWTSAGP